MTLGEALAKSRERFPTKENNEALIMCVEIFRELTDRLYQSCDAEDRKLIDDTLVSAIDVLRVSVT